MTATRKVAVDLHCDTCDSRSRGVGRTYREAVRHAARATDHARAWLLAWDGTGLVAEAMVRVVCPQCLAREED